MLGKILFKRYFFVCDFILIGNVGKFRAVFCTFLLRIRFEVSLCLGKWLNKIFVVLRVAEKSCDFFVGVGLYGT